MSEPDEPDFYVDPQVGQDPYPYYERLRAQGPVRREPHHATVLVTGYEEAVGVLNDAARFSACNTMSGPFSGFPGAPEGADDVSRLIEQSTAPMPLHEHFPTFDPPAHTDHRALLMRLITPKRLAENEAFMWGLADRQIDELLARGECEFIRDFSNPYVNLVICDLLGVPDTDLPRFRRHFDRQSVDVAGEPEVSPDALTFLDDAFTEYVVARRREPRDDVLTGLATATFPDGTLPEVIDVVRIAAFLFAAGGETTARLLAFALRALGECPELQEQLRRERNLIPAFIEEMLRMESPIRANSRLTRVSTTVVGVEVPAGTTVTMLLGAANRDPRVFDHPDELDIDRANARRHIAFGHGIHTCPGAPLARAEARIALERLLDRMADIRISEEHHGPAGERRYDYTQWYLLRGLSRLYLEFTPVG